MRRGAELDYLKFNGKEYLSVSRITDKQERLFEFQTNHPRYDYLVQSRLQTLFSLFFSIGEQECTNCKLKLCIDTTLQKQSVMSRISLNSQSIFLGYTRFNRIFILTSSMNQKVGSFYFSNTFLMFRVWATRKE